MREYSTKDLEIYQHNLERRKETFVVHMKRSDKNILLKGKRVAKLYKKNTVSNLDKEESSKVLNLFASVKKSINRYLIKNDFKVQDIVKKYDSSFSNRELFKSLEIGTTFYYVDVKHCYWRIAYLLGYISEYLYNKILENPDMKLWRNMALSCIIAPQKVEYYVDGKKVNFIEEDTSLYERVYESIRFFAWNIFGKLCYEKIGTENCLGYYTDGILVFKENLRTVQTVLARHQLQFTIVECKKPDLYHFSYGEKGKVKRF